MVHLKSAAEIEKIRASCRIAADALGRVRDALAPGVTTGELDEIADAHIRSQGGIASAKGYRGYPASICVSINEEVVHGIPAKRPLQTGDILSVDIAVKKDTMAWRLFGREDTVRMRFRHRYEVDPRYIDRLTKAGLVFSGKSPQYEIMQILELPEHPYFIGTQAHPCLTSRPLRPNPMFLGLAAAALARAYPADALPQVTAVLDPQAQQHSSAASR